jgi:hypothetical protein
MVMRFMRSTTAGRLIDAGGLALSLGVDVDAALA